ncbi:MAG: hypothetical protein Q9174_005816 [Haloplaca sp. 1 TL-2023]
MPSKNRRRRKAQRPEPARSPSPDDYVPCRGPVLQHYRTHTLVGRFDAEDQYGDIDLYSFLYGEEREASYCHECQGDVFINLPCPSDHLDHHCGDIVVSVDGACRNQGTADIISSYGVYFANSSPHNLSATIDALVHTGQRAELNACVAALEKVYEIQKAHNRGLFVAGFAGCGGNLMHLTQVIIKADSAFLVSGVTELLDKWKANGYKNAKGLPVANADLFESIDMAIDNLKDLGIAVAFWLVPKTCNWEADGFANEALDAVTNAEPSVE